MTLYHDICGEQAETVVPLFEEEDSNFFKKVRSFVDAIKTGGPAPVPTSQIVINQAIIDGIVRSAKLGREIEIDIPEI